MYQFLLYIIQKYFKWNNVKYCQTGSFFKWISISLVILNISQFNIQKHKCFHAFIEYLNIHYEFKLIFLRTNSSYSCIYLIPLLFPSCIFNFPTFIYHQFSQNKYQFSLLLLLCCNALHFFFVLTLTGNCSIIKLDMLLTQSCCVRCFSKHRKIIT